MARAGVRGMVLGAAAVAVGFVPSAVGAGEVSYQGTLEVDPMTVAIGDQVTVRNADDESSKCFGSGVVIFEPFGNYLAPIFAGDDQGNWSVTVTIPFEWGLGGGGDNFTKTEPGTYQVVAECFGSPVASEDASAPAQQAGFSYEPAELTIVEPTEPTGPTTSAVAPTTSDRNGAVAAVQASPRFTG